MITQEGCQARRQRLLDRLHPTEPVVFANPLNLRYFAGAHVDAFSLGADYGALLVIEPGGNTTLYHDHRLPKSIENACVDRREALPWYDGKTPGRGPRPTVLVPTLQAHGGRIHDALSDPGCEALWAIIADLRRAKDPDEVELLRTCMRATEVGHAWALQNVRPGMTELEVYSGMFAAVMNHVGHASVLYGDFTVSPGSAKRGGPPTRRVLESGDTLILDYSVILGGYRSDFTNTLVVGGQPTAQQQELLAHCQRAMTLAETRLKAGATCQSVYDAIHSVFESAKVAQYFPHHAGHGLGISHPEAPFFVKNSNETLIAGDVVTLEPGLYVDGIGGVRIEHNYLITATGYERLSQHDIRLA
ncbi:MAG: M24 family metallopeptidase [Fimbriiglobus sp.]